MDKIKVKTRPRLPYRIRKMANNPASIWLHNIAKLIDLCDWKKEERLYGYVKARELSKKYPNVPKIDLNLD